MTHHGPLSRGWPGQKQAPTSSVKPTAPSTSRTQPTALNATRFTMCYWMHESEIRYHRIRNNL